MGERFRKATPTELRWYSGGFALTPIWFFAFVRIGHSYLNHAGAIGIWIYMMGLLLGGFLSLATWVRFVSADVSWWISGLTWFVALLLAFNGRFFR